MQYGDEQNVANDVKVLTDIINRQGSGILIEVIAELVGRTKIQFDLNEAEIAKIRMSLREELNEALNERV